MATSTFTEWLSAEHDGLSLAGAHQNVFSQYYTEWLTTEVVGSDDVKSWIAVKLDGDMLAAFQGDSFTVVMNQNSTGGAPYLDFGSLGTFSLGELFTGDKDSFSWTQGRAEQTRYFFDTFSLEADRSAPTDISLIVDPTNVSANQPHNFQFVAELQATDQDSGDFTFSFTDGTISKEIDGTTFEINGNMLVSDGNMLADKDYEIEIRVAQEGDPTGMYYDETFHIITDAAGNKSNTLTGDDTDDVIFGGANIQNPNPGPDIIQGNAGDDTLFGQDGNDIISGGAGNDTLYGGAGSDVFKWSLGDEGTVANPATDMIMDFSKDQNDVLNLADLLTDSDAVLSFGEESGNAVLSVETTGSGVDQQIVFDNWSLAELETAFSVTNANDLIASMITNGNLITD